MDNQKGAVRKISHYSSDMDILLVGEGDFSFAAALARAFKSAPRLHATSLDSREMLHIKYGGLIMEQRLGELALKGAVVMNEVDVRTMLQNPCLRHMSFDRIVYNFPHSGFLPGPVNETTKYLIQNHRRLMRAFFKSASGMLKMGGEVHVAQHMCKPYSDWKLPEEAAKSGLQLQTYRTFNRKAFLGYRPRRGDGDNASGNFQLRNPVTFIFILKKSSPSCPPERTLSSQPGGLPPNRVIGLSPSPTVTSHSRPSHTLSSPPRTLRFHSPPPVSRPSLARTSIPSHLPPLSPPLPRINLSSSPKSHPSIFHPCVTPSHPNRTISSHPTTSPLLSAPPIMRSRSPPLLTPCSIPRSSQQPPRPSNINTTPSLPSPLSSLHSTTQPPIITPSHSITDNYQHPRGTTSIHQHTSSSKQTGSHQNPYELPPPQTLQSYTSTHQHTSSSKQMGSHQNPYKLSPPQTLESYTQDAYHHLSSSDHGVVSESLSFLSFLMWILPCCSTNT